MTSRAKELADAEAERAEAEDAAADGSPPVADDADDEEAEDEAPPPDGAGIDEDALAAESKRHVAVMRDLLGELFPQAAACVHCDGSGVTPEALEQPPDLADDPGTARCEPCHGLGLVKTGSLRDGQEERSCQTCSGNGYITKPIEIATPQFPGAPAPAWDGRTAHHLPPAVPAGTLEVLRAAGYMVVEPPPGAPQV